ncbi:MAG: transcriptional regulator [Campylobacterales bacterium]|nr:transcriptional regulator [Campylobacterales bacterium]
MNKRDIAGYLGIDRTTLYNWEKYKPNLYKTVMLGLMVDEVIHKAQKNVDELLLMKSSLDKRNENSTDNTK